MFDGIIGHEKVLEFLGEDVKNSSFSHAYLFVGPKDVGKHEVAKAFTRNILCNEGLGCGECISCKNVMKEAHPDVLHLGGETSLKMEEAKDIQKFLSLKPYMAARRVVIIKGVDRMTREASNSLLKTLEEPVGSSVIILTTPNKEKILETIVSRCRVLSFGLVEEEKITQWLNESSYQGSMSVASLGRPGLFKRYMEDSEFRQEKEDVFEGAVVLFKKGNYKDKFEFVKTLAESENLAYMLDFFMIWFRDIMLLKSGCKEKIANKKDIELLEKHSSGFDDQSIEEILMMIERVKNTIGTGVNAKLSLEVLSLKMEGI